MKNKGQKMQFSLKTQTNEEVFCAYAFEAVPENFASVSAKKERRAKMIEVRAKRTEER